MLYTLRGIMIHENEGGIAYHEDDRSTSRITTYSPENPVGRSQDKEVAYAGYQPSSNPLV